MLRAEKSLLPTLCCRAAMAPPASLCLFLPCPAASLSSAAYTAWEKVHNGTSSSTMEGFDPVQFCDFKINKEIVRQIICLAIGKSRHTHNAYICQASFKEPDESQCRIVSASPPLSASCSHRDSQQIRPCSQCTWQLFVAATPCCRQST